MTDMKKRSAYRSFLSYIDLSREYYAAYGYTQPYKWRSHASVPFTKLDKPLSQCRVGLMTTTDLEENNIPTVVIGSARDIVEECGVPRFLFTDFPLGNPCGKPWDKEMQRDILEMALDLLQGAWQPRTTVQAPFVWSEDATWRTAFMHVSEKKREELKKAGEARRTAQAEARAKCKQKE